MPRFSANLSMLHADRPFLDRFAAADTGAGLAWMGAPGTGDGR
jgi:hydroxypyruvate isomerase